MTLDIPNLKDFDQRLRDEAAEEPTLEIPQAAAQQADPDHRDLWQGGHRQIVHAGQPVLHDGRNGQARAADRL
jgi:hypothetical protein